MKKSLKAGLLSGLIFPGLGHFVVGAYRRGTVLLLVTAAALWKTISIAVARAMEVVDQINNGEIAPDIMSVQRAVENSTGGVDSRVGSYLLVVLLVCWVIGIVDSYRLGTELDKKALQVDGLADP